MEQHLIIKYFEFNFEQKKGEITNFRSAFLTRVGTPDERTLRRPPRRWRTRGIGCGGWSQPRRCSGSGCCWRRTVLFLRVDDTLAGASRNPRDSAGKSSWKIKKEQKPLKRHPAPYVSYSLYPDVGRERVRDGSIIPFVPPILQQPFQLLFLSFPPSLLSLFPPN